MYICGSTFSWVNSHLKSLIEYLQMGRHRHTYICILHTSVEVECIHHTPLYPSSKTKFETQTVYSAANNAIVTRIDDTWPLMYDWIEYCRRLLLSTRQNRHTSMLKYLRHISTWVLWHEWILLQFSYVICSTFTNANTLLILNVCFIIIFSNWRMFYILYNLASKKFYISV